MIYDPLILLSVWLAGCLIGGMFFGGLWWTVRKALESQQPALWVSGSLLCRMAVALLGFYFVSSGHWQRMLMCLFGFVVARAVVLRLTRGQSTNHSSRGKENQYAHQP